MVRAIIVERRPGRLPRADAAAHHGRGHGMVALFISQQAMAELTCAADPGRLLAPGTATGRPVSGLPVHGEVNADPVPLCRPCADQGKENAASEGLGSMAMIWCWKLHRFFRVKSDHPAPLLVVFYSLNHISELGTS